MARILICSLCLFATTPASGQAQSFPRISAINEGSLGVGLMWGLCPEHLLLEYEAVRKELKIEPEQIKAIKSIDEKRDQDLEVIEKQSLDAIKAARAEGNNDAVAELAQRWREAQRARIDEATSAAGKKMTKTQRTRLREIQLQAEGPVAFRRPEIQERLNMDQDQVALVLQIVDQGRAEMNASFRSHAESIMIDPRDRAKATASKEYQAALAKSREAAVKSRQETMQKIGKVLTRKQRQTFDRLLGEPFDLAAVREKREVRPAPAKPKS
ncbi:MAG: hypothetical protein U0794_06905 [Isosphaeraceae bacterium]